MRSERSVVHVVPASRPNPWLADAIRAAGAGRWRQLVVSLEPAGELQRGLRLAGTETFALGARGRVSYLAAARRLSDLLQRERADLIHSHLFDANLVAAAARWSGRRVPLVITRHEPPHFMRLAPVGAAKRLAYLWLDGQVNRSATALIAPSARTEEELVALGVRPERIHRIPLGLDLRRLRGGVEAAVPARGGGVRVGIFGRLSWEKSVDTALRAWPLVVARHPEAILSIVGDGPLRRQLEDLAGTLGVRGSVRFEGWRDDVPALMSAMDVVIHTSRTESTGMVLIEALVRRRPLVVTPVGIVGEHLRHGEDCLVVPHGAAPDVAEAVLALLADPQRARDLADHGCTRILATFEAAPMANAYLALYDRVVGSAS